ncbi:Hypothetical protein SCF082_LOCUS42404 [Durusdinium trenchii]|uniref:K Homology domain-containing protein n=1 Tax=Durusdinium trenchii TaxID=1381693 RepID=A0ABP0QNT0_9DINO
MQPDPNDRRPVGFESAPALWRFFFTTWHPDPLNPQMKPPVKLWLPSPRQSSAPELQRHHQPPADDRSSPGLGGKQKLKARLQQEEARPNFVEGQGHFIRWQIPRGPPDLPTGTEVIEQKCVAYLIGKGGQALAAINAAAGVSIQIDQSTKSFGWSMANIYGTEEGAAKAKMILRQKVSEYRPLRA